MLVYQRVAGGIESCVFCFNFILPLLLEEMIQVVEKFSSNGLKLHETTK